MEKDPDSSSSRSIERHPDDPAWRADALGASRHSRLADEIRPPGGRCDPEAAVELCADLARAHLGDFAPALALLTRPERRRAQALVAHTFTLFDFARQRGIEGDRLAALNRWEYGLDEALSGRDGGQPIFAGMGREQGRRRWPADGLDALSDCARSRALRPGQPATAEEAERHARALSQAFGRTWIGHPISPEIESLGAGLIRLERLQRLGAETAAGRCPLPKSEVGDALAAPPAEALLLAVAKRECVRLRVLFLRGARGLPALPAGYRQTVAYALFAGLALLSQIEEADGSLLTTPPRIGFSARIGLLARARWMRV